MSEAVARIGDDDFPHIGTCTSPMKRAQGSGNIFVNGRAVTYKGALNTVHFYKRVGKFCITHVGAIRTGSTTVNINSFGGVGRQFDDLVDPITGEDCTSIATGSPNVFSG